MMSRRLFASKVIQLCVAGISLLVGQTYATSTFLCEYVGSIQFAMPVGVVRDRLHLLRYISI